MPRSRSSRKRIRVAEAATPSKNNDDDPLIDAPENISITSRSREFTSATWWMVDIENNDVSQGATPLVKRCMRVYNWDLQMARKVLKAYRQFLFLKKHNQDWDAEILSPSLLVDQMWHQHILDVVNYCHDSMLLCGHVVGHNPDGALDVDAKRGRDERTREGLEEHFKGSYNADIWGIKVPQDESDSKDDDQENEEPVGTAITGEENRLTTAARGRKETEGNDDTLAVVTTDEEEGGEEENATLKIRHSPFGDASLYRVQRSTRLSKYFRMFALSHGKQLAHFTFKYNDYKIDGRKTINSLRSLGVPEYGNRFEVVAVDKGETARRARLWAAHAHEQITVRVKDQSGEEMFFKVEKRTRMKKIFNAYATRKGVSVGSLRFLLDGDNINGNSTPLWLEMKDQEQVDAVLEQVGC